MFVILTTPRPAGRDGNAGRLASGSHVTLAGWQRLRHPPWLLVVMVVAAAVVVVVGGGVGAAAVAANSAKGSGDGGGGSELAARLPSQSEVPARFCTSTESLKVW